MSHHLAISDDDHHRRLEDSTALSLGLSGLILADRPSGGVVRLLPQNLRPSYNSIGLFPAADEIPRNPTQTMSSDEGAGGEAARPLSPESVV